MRSLTFLVLALVLAGCSSALTSIGPPPPVSYTVIGPSSGSACGFLLLDVIPISINDRTERAYDEAIRKASATALIDTSIVNSWYYALFGVIHCTDVAGTAIRAN
jgi:hypothetical protein